MLAVLAGCGDDTPARPKDGGNDTGSDVKPDAGDAGDIGVAADAMDALDARDTGTDTTDARDTGADTSDARDTGADTSDVRDTGVDTGTDTRDSGVDADAGGGVDADAGGGADADSGAVDTGSDVVIACYDVTFVAPTNGQALSANDDKSGDLCADGFTIDVVIGTTAPAGTTVQLFLGTSQVGVTTVAGGQATFGNIRLATSGDSTLSIQFPATSPCTAPSTRATVNVDCSVPTCAITSPVLSATHPALNGIPVAQGGDRVSADGQDYQAAFEVTTNVQDGQTVALLVANNASPGTPITVQPVAVAGGRAAFPGVTLKPDGTYQVRAQCTARNGVSTTTAISLFPVDTTPPTLTVSRPTNGQFFGPGDLNNGTFQVCGSTTSADAVGLPSSLGAAANNFCLASSTTCVALASTGNDGCVPFTCPGGAPFDINVVLNDAAGNKTTARINGVACASALPSVQIVSPVSDAPTFNDPSRHLLAASSTQAFKDQQAGMAGAQTDVVACTNRSGTARLFAGAQGGALTQVGGGVTAVAAVASDNCPAALGFVARFSGVTLPESVENASGALVTATELRVDVTDISTATGSSALLDIWVDSVAPTLSLRAPAGLCGSFHQAATTFVTAIDLNADTGDITLTVTNGSTTDTLVNPTFAGGVASFSTVTFDQGLSNVVGVGTDPAGNSTTLQPTTCNVTVGAAPVVAFTVPAPGQQLCASGSSGAGCVNDADAVTTGWQGSLTVHVTGGGAPVTTGTVTFSVGATTLGISAINGSGDATLPGVTFNDGTVTIVATTSDIPGRGVGSGTITVSVDTGPPGPPTALGAVVLSRRQTSFQLSWIAPSDNGQAVAGYQVRYAKVAITAANFDNTAVATAVTYTGSPASPGSPDGIAVTGLYIENGYFFAVAAVDETGARSTITATTSAVKASFLVSLLSSPSGTNQLFGAAVDGSADVNGDGVADLLVGTANNDTHGYIYFGAASFAPTAPSVVLTGGTGGFGSAIRHIGDIDRDTFSDIAVADPSNARVLIYKGRASWPIALTDAQADYVITTDATYAASAFGFSIAPLGDFDGDGADDFVIGAPAYAAIATRVGRAVVVYGRTGFTSFAVTDTTRALAIDGDGALNRTQFGLSVVGLGHFYSVTTGTTLVVSAPGLGAATSTSANEGRLYAFHGRGPGAAISVAVADNVRVGPGKGARIGQTLTNLGPLVSGPGALGSGNSGDGVTVSGNAGTGYVTWGTAAGGPLTNLLVLTQSGSSGNGQVLFGGGFSGRDSTVSLIGGDSKVDLATTSQTTTTAVPSTLDIFDGNKVSGLSGTVNSSATADVHVPMPTGWIGTATGVGSLVRDIDNDGFPDFALGDQFGIVPGRVAVFR